MFYYKVYRSLGLGTKLTSNVPWPILNCENENSNEEESLSTVNSVNQSVTEDKSPAPSIDVSENKPPGSPVKVCLINGPFFYLYLDHHNESIIS